MIKRINIILIFTLFISALVLANGGISLKYPGNGIPILSKDKPVKKFNDKMFDFFSKQQGVTIKDKNILFKESESDILFESQCFLSKEPLTLKIPFMLQKGKITISIGKIDFVITPTRAIIYENDIEMKSKDISGIKGISLNTGYGLDNVPETNVYIVSDGYADGLRVKLAFPSYITIRVSRGSIGIFEKFMWGRGYL